MDRRPVVILDAIKALIAVAVAFGWITLGPEVLTLVLTAAGALVTVGLTFFTQSKVTPVAEPRGIPGYPAA